jgi:type VI secretion system secreted protein Hcp
MGVWWQIANPKAGANHASAAVGVTINMTVTGQKQGQFKGDDSVLSKRKEGLITVVGFQFEIVSPRDAATGLPTGKRSFKPLVVTHVMGGSSPQFLTAVSNNENLKSVVINFFRMDRNTGEQVNYYRITLKDANVAQVRQYTSGAEVLEDDSLTFRTIEEDDLIAKTTFLDTWEQAAA